MPQSQISLSSSAYVPSTGFLRMKLINIVGGPEVVFARSTRRSQNWIEDFDAVPRRANVKAARNLTAPRGWKRDPRY